MAQAKTKDDNDEESNDGIRIPENRKDSIPLESAENATKEELELALEGWTESYEPTINRLEFIEEYVFPNQSVDWNEIIPKLDMSLEELEMSWWEYQWFPQDVRGRGNEVEIRLFRLIMPDAEDGELYCPNCSGTLHEYGPFTYEPLKSRFECEDCGYSHDWPWRDIETLFRED